MKPAFLMATVLVIVVIGLGWRAILFVASSLIFAIGRAAYEQAAHLLGL